jgi:hypothetical protein
VSDMQRYLFVHSMSGKWDTAHQSRVLRETFTRFALPGLSVAQWRQVAVSIASAHLQGGLSGLDGERDEDASSSNYLDLQRNHSTSTANQHYGHSGGAGVVRDQELCFKRASEVWQDFWKVSLISSP